MGPSVTLSRLDTTFSMRVDHFLSVGHLLHIPSASHNHHFSLIKTFSREALQFRSVYYFNGIQRKKHKEKPSAALDCWRLCWLGGV
jgi:hypothetical protein